MVIDFQVLNKILAKDYFSLLLPRKFIEKFQEKEYFSKLDIYARYDLERLIAKDIQKTAYVVSNGQ
jgi:hypothetical protein